MYSRNVARHPGFSSPVLFLVRRSSAVRFTWAPLKIPEIQDALLGQRECFGFEELALEGSIGLADEQLAVGANHAVPRDAFAARARGHGASGCACAARQADRLGDLAVSHDSAAGNFLHESVYAIPIHRICSFNKGL